MSSPSVAQNVKRAFSTGGGRKRRVIEGLRGVSLSLEAGEMVKEVAEEAGGNGAGKPYFARAGSKESSGVDDALNAVPGIVKAALV